MVDQGGHDIAVARLARLNHHHVSIIDLGIDHALSAHLQGEAAAAAAEACAGDVDLEAPDLTGGLDAIGVACGDGADDGYFDDFGGVFRHFDGVWIVRADDTEGAGLAGDALEYALALKGAEVAHHGVGAAEVETLLDLADARPEAVAPFMVLDEFQYFLLTGGEFFHGVRMFR